MKFPFIEPLEQRIAPAALNPTAISISDAAASPTGTSGTSTMVFLLTLDHAVPAGEEVVVHYHTTDGTAKSSGSIPNFSSVTDATITFGAGDTVKTVPITIDSIGAFGTGDLNFQVKVDSAALDDSSGQPIKDDQSNPIVLTETRGAATGTIHYANIPLPTVSISSDASAQEGLGEIYTVSLSAVQNYDVTVHINTVNGTAVAGTDYTGIGDLLVTIPAGSLASPAFSVNTTNEFTPITTGGSSTPTKAFTVQLANAHLGDPQSDSLNISKDHAAATILPAGDFGFQFPTSVSVDEAAGTATINVTRTGNQAGSVSIIYTMSDGTAKDGIDYTASSGTLVFDPQHATASVKIPIADLGNFSGDSAFFNVQFAPDPTDPNASHINIPANQSPTAVIIHHNDSAPNHIALSSGSYTVNEGDGTVTLLVNRTGDLSSDAKVQINFTDGTAKDGTDYTALDKPSVYVVDIPAGVSQVPVVIPILDAHKSSGTSQFSVSLSDAVNADFPGTSTATVTINDAELSHFSVANVTANETSGKATLVITRSGDLSKESTVQLKFSDGTAMDGTDYTSLHDSLDSSKPLVVDFPAGVGQVTVNVPLIDSHKTSGTSQFGVNLAGATGFADVTGTSATVTINENDAGDGSHFSIDSQTVDENAGTVTLTVTRSGNLTGPASVSYHTANGTGLAGTDYTQQLSTALNFAADSNPSHTSETMQFTIPILDRHLSTGSTNFTVVLTDSVYGDLNPGTGLNTTGTVTINDNDPAPSHFSLQGDLANNQPTTVVTINEDAGTATFTVKRTGDTTGTATVKYTTTDGTATSVGMEDYTSETDTLTFNPGEITKTITIPITNAHKTSGATLNFSVKLTDPTNADILLANGTSSNTVTGTVNIKDNATATAHLQIDGDNGTNIVTVDDTSQVINIQVERTGDLSQDAYVKYTTQDGTAHDEKGDNNTTNTTPDYDSASGTVHFAAGQAIATIPITIHQRDYTIDKQFTVQLSDPQFADILSGENVATVKISGPSHFYLDEDPNSGTPSTTLHVKETDGLATFTIKRAGDLSGTASINYNTSDHTATTGVDYTAVDGTLTFSPGVDTQTFTIPILDAGKHGGTNDFTINLFGASNAYVLSGNAQGTVSIDENSAMAVTDHFSISQPAGPVHETTGSVTFTITRTHDGAGTPGVASVTYGTVDHSVDSSLTAVASTDFLATSGTLQFAAGELTKTVTVNFTGKAHNLNPVDFEMKLGTAIGADIVSGKGVATVNVQEDSPFPIVSVSNASVTKQTSNTTATFTVSLSAPDLTEDVVVDLMTVDGTAISTGAHPDFTAKHATVTIPKGQTSATFVVDIAGNSAVNPSSIETFNVVAVSANAQVVDTSQNPSTIQPHLLSLAKGPAVGTIQDTFQAQLSVADAFSAPDPTVTNQTDEVFALTLTNPVSHDTTVYYTLADGTAHFGTDYDGAVTGKRTGVITIPAYQTTYDLYIPTFDHGTSGSDITFSLQLSNPSGPVTITDATGSATIQNNHRALMVVNNVGVAASYDPAHPDHAIFTVTLAQASSSQVSVHYATKDGTALSTGSFIDYQATSGDLTFAAGETTKTISVPIYGDFFAAGGTDDQFTVQLSNPVGATLVTSTGTATITNHEVGLAITGGAANAIGFADATNHNVTFTVTRSSTTALQMSVNYALVDGTALVVADYGTPTAGTVSFASGATTATISVPVTSHFSSGPDKTFTAQLTGFTGNGVLINSSGQVGAATATGTIHPASPVTLSFGSTTVTAVEGNPANDGSSSTHMDFTVNLSSALNVPVTFQVTPHILGGLGVQRAIAGVDFSSGALSETIAAGETSVTFSIPLISNNVFQDNRSFAVDLSQITAGVTAATTTAIGTILDDDVFVSNHVLKWHDIDGDTVTLKVSRGTLVPDLGGSGNTHFVRDSASGQLILQQLDLSGGKGQFAHANVSITAQKATLLATKTTMGNGRVDVGDILADTDPTDISQTTTAVDLGVVRVDGDLARIEAGDIFNDPGLKGLDVYSLGVNTSTLTGLASTSAVSTILCQLSSAHIATDLAGTLQLVGQEFGGAGSLRIDGKVLSGATILFTGSIRSAVIGGVDGVVSGIGGINNGAPFTAINSIKVVGAMQGEILARHISSLQIGSLVGTADKADTGIVQTNLLGKATIGSIVGTAQNDTGNILVQSLNLGGQTFFGGTIGTLDIGSLTAGAGSAAGTVNADAGIGKVIVRGNIDGTGAVSLNQISSTLGNSSGGDIITEGTIGSVHIMGNLIGGTVERSGSISALGGGIGSIAIDGSVAGGSGFKSGLIESVAGIGSVDVGGNVKGGAGNSSGGILAVGALNKVHIHGNLQGGDSTIASGSGTLSATTDSGFISAGTINSVTVDGSVTAGSDFGAGLSGSGLINAQGAINSIVIKQGMSSVLGGPHATISAGGKVSGVAIGKVEIDGNISIADIIAGISTNAAGTSTSFSADAGIGSVLLTGSQIASLHIAAGADIGGDKVFGPSPQNPLATDDSILAVNSTRTAVQDDSKVISKIASVIFTNAKDAGLSASTIEAQEVDSVSVPGQTPIKRPGAYPGNSAAGSPTDPLRVFELVAASS